jgi:hypothetical protein
MYVSQAYDICFYEKMINHLSDFSRQFPLATNSGAASNYESMKRSPGFLNLDLAALLITHP